MQAWPSSLPVLARSMLGVLLAVGLATALSPPPASADGDPVGVWPLRPTPEVVHDFEPPAGPYASGHRGVDLAGAVGAPVHSAMAGTISFVGRIAGKPVVVVSHGETRTTYEPVASGLAVGDPVDAGQRIGSLELAFSHCFPTACLHWGWLRGETYLDPLTLVSTARVRLLPLWRDEPVDRKSSHPWVPPKHESVPLPYAAWSPLRDFLP